ncbi:MAG: hydroxyethylthiazole kinase [Spirochaetes bacterium]|nr:hydroxyethylthiazole kinase [Spirochaetota bacterium]
MNIYEMLNEIRSKQPVIHHITNWVTIFNCAQAVKSIGASPVMAHATQEAAEMTSIASALVLNIGTLTKELIESMLISTKTANEKKIPVVLDACGAGASTLRNSSCQKLITERKIDIVKGNASEIASVAGHNVKTKGVDSSEVEHSLSDIALNLSNKLSSVVVITGKSDYVAANGKVSVIDNGTELMGRVVGTGCIAASIIGCFAGVGRSDLFTASTAALSVWGIAGEKASVKSDGAGSFILNIFDVLSSLSEDDIVKNKKISFM